FQQIYDLQDRRSTDSLYPYFTAEDPTYRYLAAMAMASIRDSTALDSLFSLLKDPIEAVRTAAVYAIGQIGSARAVDPLIGAFEAKETPGYFRRTNGSIPEAVGKCGAEDHLRSLSTVTTYVPTDTALLLGQVRGVYRFALRGIVLPEGTARMVALVSNRRY